jgi:hypothetical protein
MLLAVTCSSISWREMGLLIVQKNDRPFRLHWSSGLVRWLMPDHTFQPTSIGTPRVHSPKHSCILSCLFPNRDLTPSPQTNQANPTAPATDPTTTTHPETATSLFVTPLANFHAKNLNEFKPWKVKIQATPKLTADFTVQGREPKDVARASAERSRPSPRCAEER